MPEEPWAINIDIEGFSKNYEESEERKTYAIWGLYQLMEAIINIGNYVYINPPERIFAHQYGDGFLITSDFYEDSSERVIAVAVALMRHMLMNGYSTKSAISTGSTSDIKGCYPKPVQSPNDGTIHIGTGILTTSPVMGTALTRAHKLSGHKCGMQMILDSNKFKSNPKLKYFEHSSEIKLIDWLSSDLPLADEIAVKAGLNLGNEKVLLEKLQTYLQTKPAPPESWVNSTLEVIGQRNDNKIRRTF